MHLLYGNEAWIKNQRVEQLKAKATGQINVSTFEGKNCDVKV